MYLSPSVSPRQACRGLLTGLLLCTIGSPAATETASQKVASAAQHVLPAPAGPGRLVVRDDPGGRLRPRLRQVQALRASGTQVELRGRFCNSACTLLLGAANVCVGAQTSFAFHGPHYLNRPMPRERFEHWSARMAALYPPPLRRWFMHHARFSGSAPLRLSGADLIALGFRRC